MTDKKDIIYPRDEVHDFMKNRPEEIKNGGINFRIEDFQNSVQIIADRIGQVKSEEPEKDIKHYRDNPDAFMKDIVAEAVPLKDEAPEPPWEDAILTISVYTASDEYRYCDVTIEEWHNEPLIHPSDFESIENTLEDYELKPGRWKVQIHVTWTENPATPDCPADWDDDLEVTELEKL